MMLLAVAVATLTLFFANVTYAQQPPDVFQINYFSGANTTGNPDATVRITNPGTSGGSTDPESPGSDMCANLYIFTPDQQLTECCSCRVTPNGLLTLSLNRDLTNNPLTSIKPTTGIIKIVSSSVGNSGCDAKSVTPIAALRAWTTHSQAGSDVTEQKFSDSTLSNAELTTLQDKCLNIQIKGSGKGICACGASTAMP